MATHILLIDDDANIRTSLGLLLGREGYTVSGAASAEEGLEAFRAQPADVVLVDLMLPKTNGFELTAQLRRLSEVPVVILSACTSTQDIVAGLEAGADDYLTKPIKARELAARIRALMRRVQGGGRQSLSLAFGDIEITPDAATVTKGGVAVTLTQTEFRLLYELASRPNWVMSRSQLLNKVWGYDYLGDTRLVDVHIGRLRSKIEDDPAKPALVVTVRGLGYKLLAQ